MINGHGQMSDCNNEGNNRLPVQLKGVVIPMSCKYRDKGDLATEGWQLYKNKKVII